MSTFGPAAALPPQSDTTLPMVVGATSILWSIALITYVLRIYTRCRPYPNLGWDDLAISLSMAITTANWGCNMGIQVATGGRHIQYITRSQLETAGQLGFIAMLLWVWALTALKVSVALMLLRIKQTPGWKKGIWSLIIVLMFVGIGSTLAQLFECWPINANWDIFLRMSGRKCWTKEKQEDVTYLVSALFAATDVACALLPLLFITKINRPLREKVILFLLMALGLLACACGLVKTVLVRGVLQSTDPIWEGSSVAIWTYSEEYIGIIAANIPCLKSLLEAAFHKLGGHVTNMTKSNSKYSTNDVDSFSPPHYNLSTLTPLDKTYNTYPARIEDGSAGYHASLRETSRLRRLERSSDSQENILVEMKAFRENGHGFEFESIGIEERDMATRQVSTNRGRVDRHDPTR